MGIFLGRCNKGASTNFPNRTKLFLQRIWSFAIFATIFLSFAKEGGRTVDGTKNETSGLE